MRLLWLMLAGLSVLCWAIWLAPVGAVELAGILSGVLLTVAPAVACLMIFGEQYLSRRAFRIVADVVAHDHAPGLVTDGDGLVRAHNQAAADRFQGVADGETLARVLRGLVANPAALLYRMQRKARIKRSASEDVATPKGHVRVSVHAFGDQRFVWRIEDLPGDGAGLGSSLPILLARADGAILRMNDAARELLGTDPSNLSQILPPQPVQPGMIIEITTRSGPADVVFAQHQRGDGRREICLLAVPQGSISIGKDMFESLPVPLVKLSPDGAVLAANRMAVGMIGRAGAAPARIEDVLIGQGRSIEDWLKDTLTRHPAPQAEVLELSGRDQEAYVQVTLSRVLEDGEVRLIGVLNDATELKTLEAQFVQSQKMQAIGQLAGGVAHDFNNLLTAISGHCDLLLLRHDQNDGDYADLIQINQNANRAAALVGQLLAFSRKQTLRPEVLDLRDTLSDLTHLLNRLVGEKVVLTLSHDPVLRPIRVDKRQLEQVLMNLVVNARDAMPGGGEIRIETQDVTVTEPIERDRARVPVGEYVVVRVRDEGTGIAPGKISKVFEPFYTTKRTGEGTGLGLSTAYGIIKQTGGFIFVDSEIGSGTCFTIYLPVFSAEPDVPQPKAPVTEQAAPARGEGVVLLVEDEPPVRAFASRALRLRGYTVLEADCAEEALARLEDPGLSVDIFITDVVMPGMDGPTWVRKALQDRPDVRVVFVSGYTEGALSEADEAIPNSVFLPKPFSLNQLTETVYEQLH
ncbi:MAG: ATP-binding protein [Marinibacterium sp.]|nr:ATP-binding protein [Marinibacterium sp.]